ncbi:hypothetical protein N9115_01235 [bacterium]|nr:hypothetical protein [bacterium]MDB4577272.1 hypothetical protein [bacterium]
MINPFNPLELLPYIREEAHSGKLIGRYVWASPLERQRIMEQAKILDTPPILNEFFFPTNPTSESENLLLFEGSATAEKTTLTRRGRFKKQKISIPQILAIDKQKKFEFTIEHNAEEKVAFITVCQVYEQHRRMGYFPYMVGAIQDYCFNQLGVKTVLGHARPPRDESTQDWRTKRVPHGSSPAKISALHSLWLKQPFAVFGAIVGADDADSFAFLNPALLDEFTKADFTNWDKITPHKPKENTFVELMKRKEAA